MRICVVIASEEMRRQAGVRIRYERIMSEVAACGSSLRVVPITAFDATPPEDDIYLISKCYDARSLVLAARLRAAGRLVGVDLFDDYFSHGADSRLLRFRAWLRAITATADFILCCTPAMAGVAARVVPGLPTHVMNDPAPDLDPAALALALTRKLAECQARREIAVSWFGVGDNPHFPVGLADLGAHGAALARLAAGGFAVRLAIQTNLRALTADALARLARLPVPYTIEEWSVPGEARLLAHSVAAFIPTNGQNFSLTKSLNRALTALAAGTQVLSVGYPLYARLAPFVYRDPVTLAGDLAAGTPLLRPDTVAGLLGQVAAVGDAPRETRALIDFLGALLARQRAAPGLQAPAPAAAAPAAVAAAPSLAVIHGQKSSAEIQAFAAGMGALTVAGPYCSEPWAVDVVARFAAQAPQLDLWVSERTVLRLPREIAATVGAPVLFHEARYRPLRLPPAPGAIVALRREGPQRMIAVMAGYAAVTARLEALLAEVFPGLRCILAENSVFPLVPPGDPAASAPPPGPAAPSAPRPQPQPGAAP